MSNYGHENLVIISIAGEMVLFLGIWEKFYA